MQVNLQRPTFKSSCSTPTMSFQEALPVAALYTDLQRFAKTNAASLLRTERKAKPIVNLRNNMMIKLRELIVQKARDNQDRLGGLRLCDFHDFDRSINGIIIAAVDERLDKKRWMLSYFKGHESVYAPCPHCPTSYCSSYWGRCVACGRRVTPREDNSNSDIEKGTQVDIADEDNLQFLGPDHPPTHSPSQISYCGARWHNNLYNSSVARFFKFGSVIMMATLIVCWIRLLVEGMATSRDIQWLSCLTTLMFQFYRFPVPRAVRISWWLITIPSFTAYFIYWH